ncbi:unnamed protein product, partial [Coregonus sp. 'balchen']
MAEQHAPSVAMDAVLMPSTALPDDMPRIKGYDFNQGVDHHALLQSFLTTGFQASSVAHAIQEINKMIEKRLEPQEEEERCDSSPSHSGCTIFLGYTSNLISSGVRESIRYLAQYKMIEKRLEPLEEEERCNSSPSHSGCTIFLGYTSNLISSGVRESIRYLAQYKMVDVIVTTAGGVEEDFIKCNLLVPNDNYCKFEDWLMPILDQMVQEQKDEGTHWTPSKMIHRLGKEINNPESVYYWAYKNDIPVFSPALTDGSIGDMIYFHSYKNPGLVEQQGSVCQEDRDDYSGWGPGQTPYSQCQSDGARPDEAVSWGKIRMDAKPVKVYADASIVFPLLI